MHFEYKMLVLMTMFFIFAWVPSSIGKARSYGLKWLASNRDKKPAGDLEPWGLRCEKAYDNLKNYFPAFIVAIFLLGELNKFDDATKWLSAIYVLGRVVHMFAYGIGNSQLRFLSFVVSFLANLVLLVKIVI